MDQAKRLAAADSVWAILNSLTSLIVVIVEDGSILYANEPWTKFISSLDSAAGGNYFDLCGLLVVDPVQRDTLVSRVKDLLSGTEQNFESCFRAKAGQRSQPFLLRASRLQAPGAVQAVLVHDAVGQIQKDLVRAAQDRIKGNQREREQKLFDKLSAPAPAPVTAELLGQASLRISAPEEFERLTEIYMSLLQMAVAFRTYKLEGNISTRLRLLAEDLGDASAHPRDVIELHRIAFTKVTRTMSTGWANALLEEGRLVLLELMGHLASYYRDLPAFKRLMSPPLTGNTETEEAEN